MMNTRAQAGYTLIEIVVAFAILALGLTLLLGTLSGATRQVRQAGVPGAPRCMLAARRIRRLQPGNRDGELDQGPYRWRLEVAPWNDPAEQRRRRSDQCRAPVADAGAGGVG
jgi:general secretion pathway protein I